MNKIKSFGFYIVSGSKANSSLCFLLGLLRLIITNSTFQEVFSWGFTWVEVTLCLNFQSSSLESAWWLIYHLDRNWLGKWKKEPDRVDGCWSQGFGLLIDWMLAGERQTCTCLCPYSFLLDHEDLVVQIRLNDKNEWWFLSNISRFICWYWCQQSLNWHARLLKFSLDKLFYMFYFFRCISSGQPFSSLSGKYRVFFQNTPNALDTYLQDSNCIHSLSLVIYFNWEHYSFRSYYRTSTESRKDKKKTIPVYIVWNWIMHYQKF